MEMFKVLYMKYYQKVYVTCLLILKNTTLAEEATQEAFLKAYTKIETLKNPEKFGAWVASIAAKQAINLYNRNKKVLIFDEQELKTQFLKTNNKLLYENEPCSKYLAKEKTQEIREAIYCLSPPLSQMIILKYYWELTDPEIAKRLKLPLGTVKSSLYRARKLLVEKLEGSILKGEANAEGRAGQFN
ncbi:MAG: sigma-70 family RNA polymerase sigma factor [Clostridia bacterium]|nr:sigma-70 family RNA polymerase sigma factor [Clostridia bacterium]